MPSLLFRESDSWPRPWQFASGISLHAAPYRSTSDIRDLYHDVYIALKNEQSLDNGQPTIIARLLRALNLAPGKRVMHVGCGTGYYTAVIAEAVGPNGAVTALEVDPDLAALAVANLKPYANVQVFNQDGATVAPSGVDAILVNAGVTHPHPAWLDSLKEGGVLVVPFPVARAPPQAMPWCCASPEAATVLRRRW
jgi:protein-L-isoaspartate(D-aspartate) O-methyltransferase